MLKICVILGGIPLLFSGVFLQISYQDILDMCKQNEYRIVYERNELVRYNKEYIKKAEVRPFKYNRTSFAVNASVTLNKDLGRDVTIIVQVYKFLSNEYRYFPLRVQVKVCDILEKKIGGTGKPKCGNFTGCPFNKGTYYSCNFMNDDSKFPPGIPNGRYMVEMQGLHFETEIGVVRGYGAVTRSLT